jgi:hypothetical protein
MKIVYHCYGGAHASPTAAAIHLGILPQNRIPRFQNFKKVPFFDDITWNEHGKMIKVGVDSQGNEIFILARRNSANLIINLIKEFARLNNENPAEYHFVNCMQMFNPFMITGGFSSRAMGWVRLGRPLVTFGVMISFPILVSIVQKTCRNLGMNLEMDYRET